MSHRTWSHPIHRWHLPQWHAPALLRQARPGLTQPKVAALRRGLIVLLCALLAGSLTYHLRGVPDGPFAPPPPTAVTRA